MSYDNQGGPCGYGDTGGYLGAVGPDFYDQGVAWWTALGYEPDREELALDRLCGLAIQPMEPHFYEAYQYEGAPPAESCFDKVTFREQVAPERAYLLLDGISGGAHGHTDGNTITRFTDNGRIWIGEGDYLYGDAKDHNTLTLTRDAVGGKPEAFASLEAATTLPGLAATQTRIAQYNGAGWDRHLLWLRDQDIFLLFDEVRAYEPGQYDLKVRFRLRGTAAQEKKLVTAHQEGDERFYLWNGSGDQVRMTLDERDGEVNWSKYPFSEETSTKLVWHRWTGALKPGEGHCLAATFYAVTPAEDTHLAVASAGPGVQVLKGTLDAVVGVLPPTGEDLPEVAARQYLVGPQRLALIEGTRLAWGRPILRASARLNLELDLETGAGYVSAGQATSLRLAMPADTPVELDGRRIALQVEAASASLTIPIGEHKLQIAPQALATWRNVIRAGHAALWARVSQPDAVAEEPPPDKGLERQWTATCDGPVTALWTADLDGDGQPETVAGSEDGVVQVLDATGKQLWSAAL
jgi:hypothetical protein